MKQPTKSSKNSGKDRKQQNPKSGFKQPAQVQKITKSTARGR
jgi:hypothetical protein